MHLLPPSLSAIQKDSKAAGFESGSDVLTGTFLRTLAGSKPAGTLLELGTGTGLGSAWILDGMSADARLISVDNDPDVVDIARRHLSYDDRVAFVVQDGLQWLTEMQAAGSYFDLIFADSAFGKYEHFDLAWRLLNSGGLYIVDDMLPQPTWPVGYASKVHQLMRDLTHRNDAYVTEMNWSTGILIATKT